MNQKIFELVENWVNAKIRLATEYDDKTTFDFKTQLDYVEILKLKILNEINKNSSDGK